MAVSTHSPPRSARATAASTSSVTGTATCSASPGEARSAGPGTSKPSRASRGARSRSRRWNNDCSSSRRPARPGSSTPRTAASRARWSSGNRPPWARSSSEMRSTLSSVEAASRAGARPCSRRSGPPARPSARAEPPARRSRPLHHPAPRRSGEDVLDASAARLRLERPRRRDPLRGPIELGERAERPDRSNRRVELPRVGGARQRERGARALDLRWRRRPRLSSAGLPPHPSRTDGPDTSDGK